MGLNLLDSSPTPIINGRYTKVNSTIDHPEGSTGVIYEVEITYVSDSEGGETVKTFTYTTDYNDTKVDIANVFVNAINQYFTNNVYSITASASSGVLTLQQTSNTANPYGFTVATSVDASSVVLFADTDHVTALGRESGIIDFYSNSADAWSTITMDLTSDQEIGTYFPVFYSADGEVRVSDATLTSNTRPKGLYYLDYITALSSSHATPTGSTTVGWAVDDAYNDNSTLECESTDKGQTDPTGSFDADNHLASSSANGKVTLNFWETTDGNSTWGTEKYGLYYTLVYGNNISLPRRVMTTGESSVNTSIDMSASDKVPSFEFVWASGQTGSSWRITGMQFFLNYKGNLYFFAEIDKKLGVRLANQTKYTGWDASDAGYIHRSAGPLINPILVETFDSMNGYSWRLPANGFDGDGTGFKTACVASRRAWVGNVKIKDRQGVIQTLPDAVIKSPVNQFDVFPWDNMIEPVVNDGSEVTALYEYADRLLMFKNIDLYIINIGGQIEYLEQKVPFAGVHRPQQVCQTPFGICWINPRGIYLYSGKAITKIDEKKGRRLLSDDQLQAFTGTYSTVGYDFKLNKLFIRPGYEIPSDALIYDFGTQSWSREESVFTGAGTRGTNFTHDNEGRLIWGRSFKPAGTTSATSIHTMGDTPAAGWCNLETGFIDFGDPVTFKQLMSVYVTYTTGQGTEPASYTNDIKPETVLMNEQMRLHLVNEKGNNIELKKRNNKETLVDNIIDDGNSRAVLKYTSIMKTAELKASSSGLRNFRSIKIILTGYFPDDFVLEDITITFKPKKPK